MKKFSIVFCAFIVASLIAVAASASSVTVYDPQTAFSGSNPSGVWSYGVLDTSNANPATNFTPFTTYSTDNTVTGVNAWSNTPSTFPFPGIFNNTTSTTALDYGTIDIPGNTLVLHPPNNANQTDLRFTAPTNLTISNIAATFAAADTGTTTNPGGTSSDVHVYINGVSTFNPNVLGTAGNGAVSFNSGPLFLTAGQTVDFRVGDGGNGYSNDGTSLVASITAVPEPSSVALLGLGGLALLSIGRKRLRCRA